MVGQDVDSFIYFFGGSANIEVFSDHMSQNEERRKLIFSKSFFFHILHLRWICGEFNYDAIKTDYYQLRDIMYRYHVHSDLETKSCERDVNI